MRIVFMGSPDFALPSLQALIDAGHEIALCVCQPDKASGRGRKLKPCAIKRRALELGLPVATPDKVRGKSARPFIDEVEALQPDFVVVAAYGKILSTRLLRLPRFGAVNVHASILPRWRGAAPIQHTILAGDDETGVSIMRMEAGLDTGAVYAVTTTAIADHDTGGSLFERLAQLGAQALIEALPKIAVGALQAVPQDDSRATLAPPLSKEDGHLDFTRDADSLDRRVRAMHPWPGAWCIMQDKRLKILCARPVDISRDDDATALKALQPGQLLQGKKRLMLRCQHGALQLLRIQQEGKKPMEIAQFLSGARLPDGLTLR